MTVDAKMNCDSIARAYRWVEYAAFGPLLERARFRWLPELAASKRVLVLGDGDGRFLARFAESYPSAEVHYIDSSAVMLSLARGRARRARLANQARLNFTHGDALSTTPPGRDYDLVVSHFFMDCFNEKELFQLVDHVGPRLAPKCHWLVSDFREPRGGVLASVFRLYLRLMFAFFRYTSGLETRNLADYSAFLRKLGLVVSKRANYLGGFVFSEIWTRETAARQRAESTAPAA
jgi:ubiquinone/menaquinone biosynthesis C-methylase UbiE